MPAIRGGLLPYKRRGSRRQHIKTKQLIFGTVRIGNNLLWAEGLIVMNLDWEFDGSVHVSPQLATKDHELVGNEAACLQELMGLHGATGS
jgi:hypothetical protein